MGGHYSISEFAHIVGISRNTVRKMILSGEIESVPKIVNGKPTVRRVIPEHVLFEHYKLFRGDLIASPLRDMSIKEALIRIAIVMYEISQKTSAIHKDFLPLMEKGSTADKILTKEFSEGIAKILRQEIRKYFTTKEFKDSLIHALNEFNSVK